jgi:integrase
MTDAAPITANRTLRRLPNTDYRQREYLTEAEVERLIEAARKRGRNGARDAAATIAVCVSGDGKSAIDGRSFDGPHS